MCALPEDVTGLCPRCGGHRWRQRLAPPRPRLALLSGQVSAELVAGWSRHACSPAGERRWNARSSRVGRTRLGPTSCAARGPRPDRLLHEDRARGHRVAPRGRRPPRWPDSNATAGGWGRHLRGVRPWRGSGSGSRPPRAGASSPRRLLDETCGSSSGLVRRPPTKTTPRRSWMQTTVRCSPC